MAIYYVSATGTGGKNGTAPFDTGGSNGPFLIGEVFTTGTAVVAGDTINIINNGTHYCPDRDLLPANTGQKNAPIGIIAVDTNLRPVNTRRPSTVLLDETQLSRVVLNTNRTWQLANYTSLYGCYISTSGSTSAKYAVNGGIYTLDGCKITTSNSNSAAYTLNISGNGSIINNCDIYNFATSKAYTVASHQVASTRIHNCLIASSSTTTGNVVVGFGTTCSLTKSIIIGINGVACQNGVADGVMTVIGNTFIGATESVILHGAASSCNYFFMADNIVVSGAQLFNATNAVGHIPYYATSNILSYIDATGTRASGISMIQHTLRMHPTGIFSNLTATGLYPLPSTTGFGNMHYYGDTFGALPGLTAGQACRNMRIQ